MKIQWAQESSLWWWIRYSYQLQKYKEIDYGLDLDWLTISNSSYVSNGRRSRLIWKVTIWDPPTPPPLQRELWEPLFQDSSHRECSTCSHQFVHIVASVAQGRWVGTFNSRRLRTSMKKYLGYILGRPEDQMQMRLTVVLAYHWLTTSLT